MRLKHVIFFYIFFIFTLTSKAQSDVLMNLQWYNMSLVNPASINSNNILNAGFLGRYQWVGFEGAPLFGTIFADYFNTKFNSKFGINVGLDQLGYTQRIIANISYGYNLKLNDVSYLRFGLAAGMIQNSYNKNKIDVDDIGDAVIDRVLNSPTKFFPNLDLGIEYEVYGVTIGVAANHLTSYFFKDTITNSQWGYFSNNNHLYAMYKFPVSKFDNKVNIQLGGRLLQYGNVFQGELNATLFFVKQSLLLSKPGQEDELFWLGIGYRTASDLVFNAGVNITPNVSLCYSYDFSFNKISALGSHEISLSYRIKYQPLSCGCLPSTARKN